MNSEREELGAYLVLFCSENGGKIIRHDVWIDESEFRGDEHWRGRDSGLWRRWTQLDELFKPRSFWPVREVGLPNQGTPFGLAFIWTALRTDGEHLDYTFSLHTPLERRVA